MTADDTLKPEKNTGQEDKDSTTQSEGESEEQDFIIDLENQVQPFWESPNLRDTAREWLCVRLWVQKGPDEQVALLEDVLQCDKSEVQSMHEYSSPFEFYALVNEKETAKLFASGIVCSLRSGYPQRVREERKKIRRNEIKRKVDARQKTKKQKVSPGMPHSFNYVFLNLYAFPRPEANCREASKPAYSKYEPYPLLDDVYRSWYQVEIKTKKQRDEQIAFLLDELNLKCDKFEVRSFHEFIGLSTFNAYLTAEEAHKLSKLKMVRLVELGYPKRPNRKINAQQNFKEQTQSLGSRLSEARKNKEKWRFDEGFDRPGFDRIFTRGMGKVQGLEIKCPPALIDDDSLMFHFYQGLMVPSKKELDHSSKMADFPAGRLELPFATCEARDRYRDWGSKKVLTPPKILDHAALESMGYWDEVDDFLHDSKWRYLLALCALASVPLTMEFICSLKFSAYGSRVRDVDRVHPLEETTRHYIPADQGTCTCSPSYMPKSMPIDGAYSSAVPRPLHTTFHELTAAFGDLRASIDSLFQRYEERWTAFERNQESRWKETQDHEQRVEDTLSQHDTHIAQILDFMEQQYGVRLEQDFAKSITGDYDYCSSDYDDPFEEYEYYPSLDAAGKRWYTVNLANDMHADDQIALLLDTLNRSESEFEDIYKGGRYRHCFSAYLTEKEADEVAGLEEVEYVEPHRCKESWD
ncbi:unnamed protein product [Cuscuta campestris]|uniref:Uncharacterized protein n=1 Tax=Cuscuta campestris TaxID=132261 RepID=A0A484MHB9_9ASTE|nr:unnamed protein product [Cuscuta campestris]